MASEIGYAVRNIRVRTVLKHVGSNPKKKKCHVNLDSITFQGKPHEKCN